MSARIHFVGTIHSDHFGSERLERALKYESPDIITVECSNAIIDYLETEGFSQVLHKIDSLDFSQADAEFLKQRFGRLAFEAHSSRLHALQYGVSIHYVDSPSIVEDTKREISKRCNALREDFEYNISPFVLRKDIIKSEALYSSYQSLFDEEFPHSRLEEQDKVKNYPYKLVNRDDFMAQKIEKIVEPDVKIVHVGGVVHCLKDVEGRTLFSRLQQYNPTRATLKWYENR